MRYSLPVTINTYEDIYHNIVVPKRRQGMYECNCGKRFMKDGVSLAKCRETHGIFTGAFNGLHVPGPQLLLNHPNMVGQLGSVGMNMQPRGLAQHQHPIINFSAHHNSLVQHTMVPHLVGHAYPVNNGNLGM